VTFTAEIVVWLVFCNSGFITSCLSFRFASLSLRTVQLRNEPAEVLHDAKHWRTDQGLLVLGWFVFLAIGIVGLLIPPPVVPPPTTLYGTVVTWGLIGGVVIWGYKTVVDYVHTRHMWLRSLTYVVVDRDTVTRDEAQRAVDQKSNEAHLDSISVQLGDVQPRVVNIEFAVTKTDTAVAEHSGETDRRLDELERKGKVDP